MHVGMVVKRSARGNGGNTVPISVVTRSGNGRENSKRPQLSSTKRITTPRVINILIINANPPISYYVSISLKGGLTYERFLCMIFLNTKYF